MESEGSEPDIAACLAAARLSTSSAIYSINVIGEIKVQIYSMLQIKIIKSQGPVSNLCEHYNVLASSREAMPRKSNWDDLDWKQH